jgi:hypothetical protein
MTVSSPIKIVALLGIMAACGVFLYMQVLSPGGSSSDSAAPPVIKPLHPVKAHITSLVPTKPTAKKVTAAKVTAPHKKVTAVKVTTPHKKVTAVKVQPKPAAKVVAAAAAAPAAATPTPSNGLPPRVAEALREFPVVVVALYSPEASVDATSLGEAAAGAKAAKVGFLAINVLDQAQVSPFTDAFGVLQDPTLLIYARPGTLTFKVDGFADRQVVAQAALSAKRTA